MAANRYRIRHLAKHSPAAKRALNLLNQPKKLLGIVLVGNTIANILVSVLVTKLFSYLAGDFGVMVATACLVVFVLIFCEVIPKTIGVQYSERFALALSGILSVLKVLMLPILHTVNACVNILFKLFGIKAQGEVRGELTRAELHGVVKEETSGLSKADQSMLLGVLALDELTVADVMVPVSKLAMLDIQTDWESCVSYLMTAKASHIVVYRGNMDQILGLLGVRDVMQLMHKGALNKAGLIYALKPIVFVPMTAAVKDQWPLLMWKKNKLILVIDEYGGIKGGVSKSDIANEVMGSIDRWKHISMEHSELTLDRWVALPGDIFVRDVNRLYGTQLPTKYARTLSGLIIDYLDAIPQQSLCVRMYGVLMEISALHDGVIQQVKIKVDPLIDISENDA